MNKSKEVTDYKQINTIEAAFEAAAANPDALPGTEGILPEFQEVIQDVYKALVVGKAIRMGFKPDYKNPNQLKCTGVYDLKIRPENPTGFRFDGSNRTYTRTLSVLGPLLCQPTPAQDRHFAEVAEPVLRRLMKGSEQ